MYTIDNRQTGRPYPLGVTTQSDNTYFSVVMKNGKDCGIILYDKKTGRELRVPFSGHNKYGSIYSIALKGLNLNRYAYNFYDSENIFTDPYAKVIEGHEKWGKCGDIIKGGFLSREYDWEGDKPLKISYENSILYCLNVRAFTKHKSSGVKYKGTFKGIAEKADYLKELGITAVELMPAYEFDETERNGRFCQENPEGAASMEEAAKQFARPIEKEKEEKNYNCWGYIEGYYFAPKASFSADKDAVKELKDMIKELHRNGIEVIMQFYFPDTVKQGLILEVVKYWVLEYHIDGIHLKGEKIPVQVIATEPLLTDTKLFYYDFPYNEIYGEEIPEFRNLASYNDDYMYTARRFLKGDDNIIGHFLELQRRNPSRFGVVNYLTNYYGFTLLDMVSYEKKHNMKNGENNLDGNDYNYTWNCGVEGVSRKKGILKLRERQMKNALTMLFMAQGTPLIYSGDELGNTRQGNNNPYCQDNETGYIKWNMTATGKLVFNYIKSLISLRKSHPILSNPKELRILDYIGCGYPDISYHGEEAWRPDLNNYSRYVGVMYCGCYARRDKKEDSFFYIAYNMHWIPHTFALPKLPKNMKWCLIADTGSDSGIAISKELAKAGEEQLHVEVEPRTVQVYISKQEEGLKPELKQTYIRSAF